MAFVEHHIPPSMEGLSRRWLKSKDKARVEEGMRYSFAQDDKGLALDRKEGKSPMERA